MTAAKSQGNETVLGGRKRLQYTGKTPEERQTDQIKHVKLYYFCFAIVSKKIVVTRRNLSLFEQGSVYG